MDGRDGHHLSTGSLRRQHDFRKKKRRQKVSEMKKEIMNLFRRK